ncbi:MAG: hypothetical protein GY832_01215 [Chloroflexi bacterium]|nr:hypothetical protein [Chloroflexota bacterium]
MVEQTRTSNVNYPTAMHFDAGTTDRLVVWLQTMALNVLQKALDGKRPSWGNLFAEHWRRLTGEQRTRRGSSPDAHRSYDSVVKGAVNDRVLDVVAWRGRVVFEMRRLLNLNPFNGLSEDVWTLVEMRAWRDVHFLHDIAQRIEAALRQRVLFAAGEYVTFQLDPRTFWILIALACYDVWDPSVQRLPQRAKQKPWQWLQFWRWPRLYRRLIIQLGRARGLIFRWLRYLRVLGQDHGLDSGWATVWDQWVLLEAYRHWDTTRIPDALKQALEDLPLWQYGRVEPASDQSMLPDTLPKDKVWLARLDWQDNIPSWFGTWRRQLSLHSRPEYSLKSVEESA